MRKGEIPTVVVEINQGNRELISIEHNGMIVNPDGTLSRTPQYETWTKNKEHQLKETYETTPRLPEYLNSIPDHPLPTNLRQRWSHMGDWYDAPTNPEQEGTEFEESRVARIEPYIDVDGIIRKAMSYGGDAESLGPWYNLEDILKTFPKWRIPEPSKYYNNKRFNALARRDLQESKKERKRNRYPPIDQSSNDIQGGRGRGRGRGSERGIFQPQYRGRGRPFYSEGDRPYYRQDDRNKEREYREWDASQSADPSSRRTHEEESWQKYQEYMEYKQEGQHRDPPGYYT